MSTCPKCKTSNSIVFLKCRTEFYCDDCDHVFGPPAAIELYRTLAIRDKDIANLQQRLTENTEKLAAYSKVSIPTRDDHIERLLSDVKRLAGRVKEAEEVYIPNIQKQLDDVRKEFNTERERVNTRDTHITGLDRRITELEQQITRLQESLAQRTETNATMLKNYEDRTKEFDAAESELNAQDNTISKQSVRVKKLELSCENLASQRNDLATHVRTYFSLPVATSLDECCSRMKHSRAFTMSETLHPPSESDELTQLRHDFGKKVDRIKALTNRVKALANTIDRVRELAENA